MVQEPAKALRPQRLKLLHDRNGSFLVCWKVEACKLRGSDKQAVSPTFAVPLGASSQSMQLRIVIYSKAPGSKKPAAFRSSEGKGYIQVKCESDTLGRSAPVRVLMSVGNGTQAQPARGPIQHDFFRNAICGLPKGEDMWDFSLSVESESKTFPIWLALSSSCNLQLQPPHA